MKNVILNFTVNAISERNKYNEYKRLKFIIIYR